MALVNGALSGEAPMDRLDVILTEAMARCVPERHPRAEAGTMTKKFNTPETLMHSPEQWAAHLFSEWGADATLFVGGLVFDCKRSQDKQGEIFWRAVQEGLFTIIYKLSSEAQGMDEPLPSAALH